MITFFVFMLILAISIILGFLSKVNIIFTKYFIGSILILATLLLYMIGVKGEIEYLNDIDIYVINYPDATKFAYRYDGTSYMKEFEPEISYKNFVSCTKTRKFLFGKHDVIVNYGIIVDGSYYQCTALQH